VLKAKRQANSLLSAISNKLSRMQRDHKNLKISPEVHARLKIQAAQAGIQIMDYADLLLTLAMSESEAWAELRLAEIAKAKKPKR
jgi:hypothetical protein